MPVELPSYNPDDILCNCMQLKRQEVEVVAKKSKSFRHIVNSTGTGSVCTSCQPLIHEMMGQNLWVDVNIISVQTISPDVKLFVLGSKNKA